jgi:hypothetical protein
VRLRILDGSQQSRHPPNLVAKRVLTLLPMSLRCACDHVSPALIAQVGRRRP